MPLSLGSFLWKKRLNLNLSLGKFSTHKVKHTNSNNMSSLFQWAECMVIGRDLLRLLQLVARIPEFEKLWRDIFLNPSALSPSFTGKKWSTLVYHLNAVVRHFPEPSPSFTAKKWPLPVYYLNAVVRHFPQPFTLCVHICVCVWSVVSG